MKIDKNRLTIHKTDGSMCLSKNDKLLAGMISFTIHFIIKEAGAMKRLNKAITIFAKIFEVFCWVGCAITAVMTAVTAFGNRGLLRYLSDINGTETELAFEGFALKVVGQTGALRPAAYIILFVTMVIVLGIMAMVFRNVYLILKSSENQTKFSKGNTPFQPDNIRMVREIGIFLISVPVVEITMAAIARIVLGIDAVETSVGVSGIFAGFVVLALSQYFVYGMELQNDVDGLV